ncbi:NUDIX domain-containing protein [Sedimentitalea todarodis]|uniref:ADP-ribose pyrophosphatase n=1 Tax=Sedimentitalea todarodis TaxID=1631240 RepID=A0ABU3VCB9_9RHOB|nr:NUDIX domain-containing protein [Sedimentitalea todarodis]
MSDFFFYGTLRHLPLLQIVLGREDDTLEYEAARLADHGVFQVADTPFPHFAAAAGCNSSGILVRGITDEETARLRFCEGGFDFELRPVSVALEDGVSTYASVFFPTTQQAPTSEPWSFDDWARNWSKISVISAREVMAWYGRKTPAEISVSFPGIRRRASAFVAGQKRAPDPEWDLSQDVIVAAHHHPYTKFFSLQEIDVQMRQFDGHMSDVLNRAAILVGEAAVVLPYDPLRDCVMLVEQFRAPVFMAGDPAPWIWEPIAGLLEPGEAAETAVRREALEEAGLTLGRLEPAGEMYSSTGSSTEYLYLFVGFADLGGDVTGMGGTDEGEDIRSKVIGYEELMQGIDAGLYKDMPLVTTALWLARHRERLRTSA